MTVPTNTDQEPRSPKGPSRWQRVYTAIQSIWRGGTNSTVITVGAGGLSQAIQTNLLNSYRAKQQQADAASKERTEQTRRKRLMLETNAIQPPLEEKLRNAFHPENYARLWLTLHTSTNVMRRIVSETSKLYENPAKRSYKEDVDAKDLLPAPPVPPGEDTVDGEVVDKKDSGEDVPKDGKDVPDAGGKAPPFAKAKAPAKPDGNGAEDVGGASGKAEPSSPFTSSKKAPQQDAAIEALPHEQKPAGELNTGQPDVDQLEAVLALTGQPEKDQTPLDKLMEAYDWDTLLDQVEKLCMVCPVVWVRPYVIYKYTDELQPKVDDAGQPVTEKKTKPKVDETGAETGDTEDYEEPVMQKTGKKVPEKETGELCYIIYTPENSGVVTHPSNPAKMVAWYYMAEEFYTESGEVKSRNVIHFWDEENYTKYSADWQKILQGPEPDARGVNVAEFRINKPPVNSYYSDGIGDDLYEATLEACALKTLQNQRFKDGAFKQLAISGQADKTMQDQVMGGPPPIFVGEEGTVTVLDMQANYDQMTNVWKAREEYIAVTYGIDLAEYKGEGHPQSGFAKKLAQGKVLSESKRRRKFFQEGEQALYEATCRELDLNPVPELDGLDAEKELVTDFAEPTFEEDPQNQSKVDALELEFNVVSVIDVARRKNPDLTDIELVKLMHRNKSINDVFLAPDQSGLVKMLAESVAGGGGGAPPGGGGSPKPGMGQPGGPLAVKKPDNPFGGGE